MAGTISISNQHVLRSYSIQCCQPVGVYNGLFTLDHQVSPNAVRIAEPNSGCAANETQQWTFEPYSGDFFDERQVVFVIRHVVSGRVLSIDSDRNRTPVLAQPQAYTEQMLPDRTQVWLVTRVDNGESWDEASQDYVRFENVGCHHAVIDIPGDGSHGRGPEGHRRHHPSSVNQMFVIKPIAEVKVDGSERLLEHLKREDISIGKAGNDIIHSGVKPLIAVANFESEKSPAPVRLEITGLQATFGQRYYHLKVAGSACWDHLAASCGQVGLRQSAIAAVPVKERDAGVDERYHRADVDDAALSPTDCRWSLRPLRLKDGIAFKVIHIHNAHPDCAAGVMTLHEGKVTTSAESWFDDSQLWRLNLPGEKHPSGEGEKA